MTTWILEAMDVTKFWVSSLEMLYHTFTPAAFSYSLFVGCLLSDRILYYVVLMLLTWQLKKIIFLCHEKIAEYWVSPNTIIFGKFFFFSLTELQATYCNVLLAIGYLTLTGFYMMFTWRAGVARLPQSRLIQYICSKWVNEHFMF